MDITGESALAESATDKKPFVLVVDDDPVHHRLLELLAKRLNISVYMASSCGEAIESLGMFAFDLILMDYRMPDVDGCMCTRQIRAMKEIRADIPIIAVTANMMKGSREQCLSAGMDDFLGKPFTLSEMDEKISHWLMNKKKVVES